MLPKFKVLWITADGHLDLAKFPIGSTLNQAVGQDMAAFRSACVALTTMSAAGRQDAVVVLCGLLAVYRHDLVRKEFVVTALGHTTTGIVAEILFDEIERTVSSNTTRRYIGAVLKALSFLPVALLRGRLDAMLADRKWSPKMKQHFRDLLAEAEYQERREA